LPKKRILNFGGDSQIPRYQKAQIYGRPAGDQTFKLSAKARSKGRAAIVFGVPTKLEPLLLAHLTH
jgi:hypothetical protein